MVSPENLRALSKQVLDDARHQGAKILQSVQDQADAIRQRARESASAKSRETINKARVDADRYESRMRSAAQIEAKRLLLMKREELILRAFELADHKLRCSLEPEMRRTALTKFTFEAAVALGGGRMVVQTNESDRALITQDLLASIEQHLAASGFESSLQVGPTVDIAGGVIVSKDDGRITFDNSLEARLDRQRWTLRNEIWRLLAGGTEIEGA